MSEETITETDSNPFKTTTVIPQGLVTFSVQRVSHKNSGKIAAMAFLERVGGREWATMTYKRGFFHCDTLEKALLCKTIMKGERDLRVGQFVFAATAWSRQGS